MKKYLPFVAWIEFILILGLAFLLYRSTIQSPQAVAPVNGVAYDWEPLDEALPEAFRKLQRNLDTAAAERARLEQFLVEGDADFSVLHQTYTERILARFNEVLPSVRVDELSRQTDDLATIYLALQMEYWAVYAELAATRDALEGTPMPGRDP